MAAPPDGQDWLGAWTYAHRGLHGAGEGHGPLENSPAAFAAAVVAGLGIECDVQASGDGEAMVFHDWTLERLTDESGPLRERAADELEQIALHAGGTIPRLSTMLRQVCGRVPVLVEVKSKRGADWKPLCRSVARSVARYNGAVAVMSFDPRIVRWFQNALPGLPRGLVSGRGEGNRLAFTVERAVAIAHARPTFLAVDIRDLPDPDLARRRAGGMPILTWTVRSRALMARARCHADAAIAEGVGLA